MTGKDTTPVPGTVAAAGIGAFLPKPTRPKVRLLRVSVGVEGCHALRPVSRLYDGRLLAPLVRQLASRLPSKRLARPGGPVPATQKVLTVPRLDVPRVPPPASPLISHIRLPAGPFLAPKPAQSAERVRRFHTAVV